MTLTDAGYRVQTAGDGEAGLTACADFQPHIVITDIRMPRKDGLQVLGEVKTRFPHMEVIVATAYGEMTLAVKALQLEASDFIAKPITADGLLVAVQRAKQRILTRRKLQEDQINLLHKDKMISLGRLAASVAHEINNPLAGVLNYVRLMQRILADQAPAAGQDAKFKTYLGTIEKEIDRCSRIVANLLTFSRKSDVVWVSVDMGDVIERSLMLCGHRLALSHIAVDLDIMGPLPMVKGDPNQLQQCLINLIFNAADAMSQGGRLTVKSYFDNEADKLVVTVTDNGCGIADRDLPHIFEPFFTTKQEGQGTGLGLATTYGIIDQLGGSIGVESRIAKGTTLKIMLPAEK